MISFNLFTVGSDVTQYGLQLLCFSLSGFGRPLLSGCSNVFFPLSVLRFLVSLSIVKLCAFSSCLTNTLLLFWTTLEALYSESSQ